MHRKAESGTTADVDKVETEPRFRKPPWWVRLGSYLLLIGVAVGCLKGCVAGQFFYPDRHQHVWEDPGLPYENVYFHSADGTKLHGWFVPARGQAKGTVVHMHGNAQNLTAHYGFVYWLPEEGYNVFAFDYRGYGESDGSPTIPGVTADARAAIEYVRGRNDVDGEKILVFGQSIGASLAATVVGKYEPKGVRGVALDSPFASYAQIVGEKMRDTILLFPLSFLSPLLVDDECSPHRYVGRIAPRNVLFLHGSDDRIISHAHSEKLHRLAGEPKQLHIADGAGHIQALDMRADTYRPLLLKFFAESLERQEDP